MRISDWSSDLCSSDLGDPPRPGGLDVLSQHILGTACAGPIKADELYREITSAFPYKHLIRKDFDRTLGFVATGGYALKSYERCRRLVLDKEGFYRVAHLQHVKRYRLNVGTIVEAPVLKVRLRNGRLLGEVEQYFVNGLLPGDSFIFAGQLLAFEGLREKDVVVSRAAGGDPKVPAYAGGRLPLPAHLDERGRDIDRKGRG